jgi:CRISPR-associated protein Csb2
MRTLVSAWYRSHPGEAPTSDFVAVIEALSRHLPEIGIGKVSFAHTVHWQPNYGAAGTEDKVDAAYKNTRHENHFVATHRPVFFHWSSLDVTTSQRTIVAALLREVSYFGRAESLCHAVLLDETTQAPNSAWCRPCFGADGQSPVRKVSASCRDVFCTNPRDFRLTDLWSRRAAGLKADSPDAPSHLVNDLLSHDIKPDGALWVSYQMPPGWRQDWVVRAPRTEKKSLNSPSVGPRIARYLRFSLQCRIPLLPKFTVSLAEQFRAAANHHLCKAYGDNTPSFALMGHPRDRPEDAQGNHQHAFFLPMASGRDGMLTDLHVWCPYGLTQAETEILLRIQRLTWGNGKFPVRPVLTSMSMEPPADVPLATGAIASRIWRNPSPFVPPRYFYRGARGHAQLKINDLPERQLIECLRKAGVTTEGSVRRVTVGDEAHQPKWEIVRAPEGDELGLDDAVAVVVHRNASDTQGRRREHRIGLFFEIEFAEPVALPMPALGHSCHFGLGLFVPVLD